MLGFHRDIGIINKECVDNILLFPKLLYGNHACPSLNLTCMHVHDAYFTCTSVTINHAYCLQLEATGARAAQLIELELLERGC